MFLIDTDFSLNDYLISKGIPTSTSSLSSVLTDQLLDHLGVSKFFSDTPCNRSSFAGTISGFEIGTLFKLRYVDFFPLFICMFPISFLSTTSSRNTISHVLVIEEIQHFRLKLLIIAVVLQCSCINQFRKIFLFNFQMRNFSYMHHIAQVVGTECLLDTVYIIVNNL